MSAFAEQPLVGTERPAGTSGKHFVPFEGTSTAEGRLGSPLISPTVGSSPGCGLTESSEEGVNTRPLRPVLFRGLGMTRAHSKVEQQEAPSSSPYRVAFSRAREKEA